LKGGARVLKKNPGVADSDQGGKREVCAPYVKGGGRHNTSVDGKGGGRVWVKAGRPRAKKRMIAWSTRDT